MIVNEKRRNVEVAKYQKKHFSSFGYFYYLIIVEISPSLNAIISQIVGFRQQRTGCIR